jgi:hypothetical protein
MGILMARRDSAVPHDQTAQSERFKEMARELGCNEDEAAFKEALGHIAQQKPKDGSTVAPAPQSTSKRPTRPR